MVENQFSIGDLVAHKHYPEKAIGHITKFYDSGRVGVSDDNGTRSFLPKNLILLGASEDNSSVIELSPTAPQTTPVPPAQETEELTEHSETCSQCDSQDLRRFHYHDPNEYYFYCRDCGHEGWRHEKLPPAQVEVEKLEVEEVDAMTTPTEGITTFSEVIEHPPTEPFSLFQKFDILATLSEVMEAPGEDCDCDDDEDEFKNGCPECGSRELEATPLGLRWQTNPDYYLVLCGNCGRWWFPDKLPASLMPNVIAKPAESIAKPTEAIAAQADLELPPIPRDFSDLEQLPEWWERPILPDFRECSCGEPYDNDDDLDWVQETYGVNATYRGWKLTIYEGGDQIYATPPSGDRLYHCECELDLDGPDGQIALAQEFIDSWYFAQPSPGQLSLNIRENVARAPPPRFG